MATRQTENYKLNLWEPTDRFLREEFNEDHQKLDTALGALSQTVGKKADTSALTSLTTTVNGKASTTALNTLTKTVSKKADASALTALSAVVTDKIRLVIGSYLGTGVYGPDHPNVLEVPDAERPPRFVMILEEDAPRRVFMIRGNTKTRVYNYSGDSRTIDVEWTDKGVKWYGDSELYQLNYKDGEPLKYFYMMLI